MSANRNPAPPALALDLELSKRLARQIQQIQQHAYTVLGRLSKIFVEVEGVANPGQVTGGKLRSAGLEWYQDEPDPAKITEWGPGHAWLKCAATRERRNIPAIAIGATGELLIVGGLPAPGWIPDPTYRPDPKYSDPVMAKMENGQPYEKVERRLIPESVQPRWVEQNAAALADCAVKFAETEWLVIQPVHALLLHSVNGGFVMITTKTDPQGRSCCLIASTVPGPGGTRLFNPRGSQAHLLYGAYDIMDHTAQGRQSLAEGSFGPDSVDAFVSMEDLRKRGQLTPAVQHVKDLADHKPGADRAAEAVRAHAHGGEDQAVKHLLRR